MTYVVFAIVLTSLIVVDTVIVCTLLDRVDHEAVVPFEVSTVFATPMASRSASPDASPRTISPSVVMTLLLYQTMWWPSPS